MEELWKDIPGYEGIYQASTYGRIRSIDRSIKQGNGIRKLYGKIISQYKGRGGYMRLLLHNGRPKNHRVHRLIAITFVKNPYNKYDVNHKNGIKTDNRPENLEFVTKSENTRHLFDVLGFKSKGGPKKGKDNLRSKPVLQYTIDGKFVARYYCTSEIKNKLAINTSHISSCCLGKRKSSHGFIWRYEVKEEQNDNDVCKSR